MAERDFKRDYEMVMKMLSSMELHRPVALVTISKTTGLKLADVTLLAGQLEPAGILERTMDNGLLFYILKTLDYKDTVADIFQPKVTPLTKQPTGMSSREAIMKRRSQRQANAAAAAAAEANATQAQRTEHSSPSLASVESIAIRRSSAMNPRVFTSNPPTARKNKSGTLTADISPISRSSAMLQAVTGNHDAIVKPITQSSTGLHKAVFVNRPTGRGYSPSRSTYMATPPAEFDTMAMERSDANIPRRDNIPSKVQGPLLPPRTTQQSTNEIPEADVRQKLDLPDDAPLIAILSPRPCHELWASCSALANTGGGTIILGMRKYIQDGQTTYFIKNVNNPEEAVRTIIRNFNDRSIISDCPKDPNFIDIVEFGRKKVLTLRIDPTQLADAPLYTARDSFNMRTNQGCYMYRDGEVVHCTNEEIKALWQLRRLGDEEADWDQTGEIIPIEMKRKKKINLPPIIDDAVRPLSRKVSTYGMPIEQERPRGLPPRERTNEASPAASSDTIPPESQEKAFRFPTPEEQYRNADKLAALTQTNVTGSSATTQNEAGTQPAETNPINELLLAEDICHHRTPHQQPLPFINEQDHTPHTKTPAQPQKSESKNDGMPPLLKDADRQNIDTIALPAVEHPRLPTTRLVEIAITLCKHARLSQADFIAILQRKYNVVRDKILPKLKEHPHIHNEDGYYYYKD